MWDTGAWPRRTEPEKEGKMKKNLVLMEKTELAEAQRHENFSLLRDHKAKALILKKRVF